MSRPPWTRSDYAYFYAGMCSAWTGRAIVDGEWAVAIIALLVAVLILTLGRAP